MLLNNVLITGGCGFIGISLVKKLLNLGTTKIRIIDNLSVGSKSDLFQVSKFIEVKPENIKGPPAGIELVVGDIQEINLATKVTKGITVVFHLAANTGVGPSIENPKADMQINVLGTFNYLEASKISCSLKRAIFDIL